VGVRETSERPPEFVPPFERGLAVIRAFFRETPALTLSDMARRTGMTRASSHVVRVSLERLHSGFIPALAEWARSIDADLAGRRHEFPGLRPGG
jgi:IclR helix-turn-helix domain